MKLPEYQQLKSDGIESVFELDIVESLPCFDGHFDGHPILPGVAQITFAVKIAELQMGVDAKFRGLEVVKFQQVITPPNKVLLKLNYDADKQKLYFQYYQQDTTYSSGRILC